MTAPAITLPPGVTVAEPAAPPFNMIVGANLDECIAKALAIATQQELLDAFLQQVSRLAGRLEHIYRTGHARGIRARYAGGFADWLVEELKDIGYGDENYAELEAWKEGGAK